ncbi:MAG: lysine--tRNA ligase, partial [Boseongicola sp.]|nr:lysine--tRNA ligase [Boseongicola sp.]
DGTITFDDEDGTETTLPVTGGNVKFQWKPDFGARWAALGVDFEPYGKEHAPNTPIYSSICRVLGGKAPEVFTYELFLDEIGQKISKSMGNGISIDEWLTYASSESLSYFMYQKPKTAKRLHFDVIPKAVDEYHQQLRAFADQDDKARLANPVFHIHGKNVPTSTMVVPFAMLLNLASVSGAKDKDALWGFIQRYAPDATPETHADLDAAAGFAVRYFNDFVAPTRKFRAPNETERAALMDLRGRLAEWDGGLDAEGLQSMVFAVGKEHAFDPLRDWFKALYEVLLGASQGPRFGGFIALYGVPETIDLLDRALAGELT